MPLVTLMILSGKNAAKSAKVVCTLGSMELRYAVDLVTADDGEMSHPDAPFALLVDERQPAKSPLIAGMRDGLGRNRS